MFRVTYHYYGILKDLPDKVTLCKSLKGAICSITGVLYNSPKTLYIDKITVEEQTVKRNQIVWTVIDPTVIAPLITNKRKHTDYKSVS